MWELIYLGYSRIDGSHVEADIDEIIARINGMNYELVTIIGTIVLSWASLAWFIWTTHKDTHKDIGDLRERMVRLEGSMDVLKDLFQSSLTKTS